MRRFKSSGAFFVAFHVNDRVWSKIDPRHTGTVRAVFSGLTIRVQWDNGWISDLHAIDDQLQRDGRA